MRVCDCAWAMAMCQWLGRSDAVSVGLRIFLAHSRAQNVPQRSLTMRHTRFSPSVESAVGQGSSSDAVSSVTSPARPIVQSIDWTQLPEGCRLTVVQYLDTADRASWRTVSPLTQQDVHAATTTLAWRGDDKEHLAHVPLPTRLPLHRPSSLPIALIAGLPNLQRLNCSGMADLSSIQGVPPTLQSLDLTGCHGLDSLAPLQQCTALEHLALAGNFRAAGWVQQDSLEEALPPVMLAVSPHLTHLTLKLFFLASDSAAEAVIRSLQPLTRLRELSFSVHPGNPAHLQMFAQILGQMTDLRVLDLSDHGFGRHAVSHLAPAIRQLTQLQHLNLTGNPMDGEATTALAQAITSMPPTLTILDLEGTGEPNAAEMAPALQAQSATLRAIHLSGSPLRPEGMAALAPSLQRCTALTDMDLRDCDITAFGGGALAAALSGCVSTLTDLNISGNRFEDEGVEALAPVLGCMTALTKLDYSGNNMGPAGAAALAAALPSLTSLTSLDISSNRLGDNGVAQLAPALWQMTALSHLNCANNKLGPAGAAALASALPELTRLRQLDLNDNHLQVEGIRALAPGLHALSGQHAAQHGGPGHQHKHQHQHWVIQSNRLSHAGSAPSRSYDAQAIAAIIEELNKLRSWQVQVTMVTVWNAAEPGIKIPGMQVAIAL